MGNMSKSRKNVVAVETTLSKKNNKKAYAGEKTTPKEITLKFTGGRGVKTGLQ